MVQLTVGYLPDGTGPMIVREVAMGEVFVQSIQTAVVAAAEAVGYDPAFLKVRVVRQLVDARLDGPSAGGMLAVGIASALLGDQIRPEVCMSGTIEKNLEIRPVGRLEDKIGACQDLQKKEMIIPFGLVTMDLALKGASKEIKITEVHTLAEAYQAATGQPLRAVAFLNPSPVAAADTLFPKEAPPPANIASILADPSPYFKRTLSIKGTAQGPKLRGRAIVSSGKQCWQDFQLTDDTGSIPAHVRLYGGCDELALQKEKGPIVSHGDLIVVEGTLDYEGRDGKGNFLGLKLMVYKLSRL